MSGRPSPSADARPVAQSQPPAAGTPLVDSLLGHYESLVGYVRRRFSLGEGSRDVVHDAYLLLAQRPPRTDARNTVGLLRRVLHHLAVDTLRRSDARRAHEVGCDPALLPPAICPQPGPEQIAQGRQELRGLIAAIEALPPRCREVFILHKIHGLPQAEVARLLQVSLQNVEKHLRRGLQACQAHMQQHSQQGPRT
ncbi:MAG: RNA polymerase sigma factor [Delftia acidovorans]|nr:RNA polymerase sigma factor [Delftia acidovorans]MDR3016947.1 RNA polymerase sigma factor [Delftia acidovorans]